MSITLVKPLNQSSQPANQPTSNPSPSPTPAPPPSNQTPSPSPAPVPPPGGDVDELRKRVENRVFESYCDEKMRMDLLRQATNDCGVPADKAQVIIDMELESRGFVNEKKLLLELEAMLKQFTDKDKKLDPKEREDAMQYVCKPRSGYSKGLKFDVAETFITSFCRANRVKVKMGFFKWDVP